MKKVFDEIPCITGEGLSIKKITLKDVQGLEALVSSEKVYKYLPTFLFEKKYRDVGQVVDRLYSECFANRESVIMGIYLSEDTTYRFCGIAEFYGFTDRIHKVSIGYRLCEEYWGRGIASKAVEMMIEYLYKETDTEIINASTMIENRASARVLMKNGFDLVSSGIGEDWGYNELTPADKWIR